MHYSINIMPAWTDPIDGREMYHMGTQEFCRGSHQPLGASDAYVNYLGDEGPSAVKASYGANYARLAALKQKYDPSNFFCFNQNIVPAA